MTCLSTRKVRARAPRCEARNADGQRCQFRGMRYRDIAGQTLWLCGCHLKAPSPQPFTVQAEARA